MHLHDENYSEIGYNSSCTVDRWFNKEEIGVTFLFALGPNSKGLKGYKLTKKAGEQNGT